MTVLDDMLKWFHELDLTTPRAHQLRAGIGAAPLMPRVLGARKIEKPLGIDQFSGIPIIVDRLLPPFGWKLVDQYGATMLEGELSVDLDL